MAGCVTDFAAECEAQIGTVFPDPFYHNSTENHNLIGVANVFLSALFHDVVLDYHTPIISPQVCMHKYWSDTSIGSDFGSTFEHSTIMVLL